MALVTYRVSKTHTLSLHKKSCEVCNNLLHSDQNTHKKKYYGQQNLHNVHLKALQKPRLWCELTVPKTEKKKGTQLSKQF